MAWIPLILELVKIFGPLLGKLISRWLDKKLRKVSEGLAYDRFGDEHLARNALLDKAIEETQNPLRKRLLERIKQRSSELSVTSKGTANPVPLDMKLDLTAMGEILETDNDNDDDN